MLHYIFLEYLLHTNPHKNVYISKQNNAINIISSDSESTINFTLENHVFGKPHILSFFLILKGLCPVNTGCLKENTADKYGHTKRRYN